MALKGKRRKVSKGRGRQQARAANPQRQQALYKFYNARSLPLNLAKQRFRFTGYLRASQRKLALNPYLNQMQWQDLSAQVWLQGSAILRTVSNRREHIQLAHGDVVRAEVFWDRGWRYLWDMRVWDPDRTLTAGDPQTVPTLYDDLYLLSLSLDDFVFHNLYCHEILIRIARRYKIPLGQVAMGTHKIKLMHQPGISPIDAIAWAYQVERNHTGRRFVARWIKGKLHVLPLRRNPLLYVMKEQLIDATVHHTTPQGFATALTGRSSVTDSKGRVRKHSFTVSHNVEAYGYVHQQMDFSQNYNETALASATKSELAKRQIIGHSIDFDHQGIALIRKGDGAEIVIPQEGYVGRNSVVWVSDITHTLAPGQYTMTPTVTASDPLGLGDVVLKQKSKSARARKRAQRHHHKKTYGNAQTGLDKLLAGGSGP